MTKILHSQGLRDPGKDEYREMVARASRKTNITATVAKAFLTGGSICLTGEMLRQYLLRRGLAEDAAGTWTSVILVFCSALLTGLGVYQKLHLRRRRRRHARPGHGLCERGRFGSGRVKNRRLYSRRRHKDFHDCRPRAPLRHRRFRCVRCDLLAAEIEVSPTDLGPKYCFKAFSIVSSISFGLAFSLK